MSNWIVVTQPYVPAYRVPLFDELSHQLSLRGLNLKVLSSRPTGTQQNRGDTASGDWHQEIRSRDVKIARWSVARRDIPRVAANAALMVTELEALNATAWRDTLRKRPTVLWGHGKGFVNDTGAVSDLVESFLASRADHVMTYSEAGRAFLLESGRLPESRVTAIGNSTDTVPLRKFTQVEIREIPRSTSPSALYVGGLDRAKRIEFLLDTFRAAKALEPTFKLTIVGKGDYEPLVVEMAAQTPGLTHIEAARGEDLARLGARADAMWIPGRVGLVAVDALAMGLPVHTTAFKYHAPEIEFLRDGEVEYLGPSAAGFAEQSLALIANQNYPRQFRTDYPTVQAVATNMVKVFEGLL